MEAQVFLQQGEGHQLISKAAIKRVTCGKNGVWLHSTGAARRIFIYSSTGEGKGTNMKYWLYVALMEVSI